MLLSWPCLFHYNIDTLKCSCLTFIEENIYFMVAVVEIKESEHHDSLLEFLAKDIYYCGIFMLDITIFARYVWTQLIMN